MNVMRRAGPITAVLVAAMTLVGCSQPPAATPSESTVPATPASTAAAVASEGPTSPPTAEPTPEPTREPTREPEQEPTEWPCPTDPPITVYDLTYADPACFGRDEIRVRAWLERGPTMGWLPPTIEPAWLAYPPFELRYDGLWSEPRRDPDLRCVDDADCAFRWFHLRPDAAVDPHGPARWVIAIGHVNDPAAERCRWVYLPDQEPIYDDAEAVDACRHAFVLDAIKEVD